jgi:hypothetical protein
MRATSAIVLGLGLLLPAFLATPATAQDAPVSGYDQAAEQAGGDVADPGGAAEFRRLEVLLEGGPVVPLGDLGSGFRYTSQGFGAELGYAIGLRTRFFVTRTLSVAPSFTYIEFGDHDGIDADGNVFKIRPTALRYGLDFAWIGPPSVGAVRPLVGVGLAVTRNRYRDEDRESETFFEAGVNALVPSVALGLRWGGLEAAVQHEFDRFTTGRFFSDLVPRDLDWDHVLIRFAYVLPAR